MASKGELILIGLGVVCQFGGGALGGKIGYDLTPRLPEWLPHLTGIVIGIGLGMCLGVIAFAAIITLLVTVGRRFDVRSRAT